MPRCRFDDPYFLAGAISSYLRNLDRDYYYGYIHFASGEPYERRKPRRPTFDVYNLSTGERIIVTANMCDQTLTTPRTNRVQNNDILEIRSRE